MKSDSSNYIVAIGASAGGLEELQHFFDHTPLDGVSYVIVQHLSPDFKSRMVELLAKHSRLKVREARENMVVQDNQVYLIPSKKFMTIKGGRLHLTEKAGAAGPHLTINTFLKSLATAKEDKAIAVILSGLGSDGTEGAMAIHEHGGVVIAREPSTSEFSSMPAHVIAAGVVDYILEPELMPAAIEFYVKNDGALLPQAINNQREEKIIEAIIDLIKDRLPYDFSDYKQTTVLRRIKRRATSQNFTKLEAYLAYCKKNKDEVEALAKDFLISVTSFFRDKGAFNFIQKNILPAIIKHNFDTKELKFWVAGCATGEEAYSLAIMLKECLTGRYKNYSVKIFATDIDTAALAHAGQARYPDSIKKDVSAERLSKFFTKEENNYTIKPEIRRMVIFAKHDLVKNPPYCNIDLISCRNLLIYMTAPLQKKIYHLMLFGLKKSGYLFLGSSENAHPINSAVELLDKKWRIYKNTQSTRAIYPELFSLPDLGVSRKGAPDIVMPENANVSLNNLTETISNEVMNVLGHMLACVNEDNQIIKLYGDTTGFLLQKNFNTNMAELLPERLSLAFKSGARKAFRSRGKVFIKGIKTRKGDELISTNLLIKPLYIKVPQQKLLMALFTRDAVEANNDIPVVMYDDKLFLDEYSQNIEEEIKELKIELHKTEEKLDASNENLQSYNEELLSANEEMQSTNEEMQSVNEELHTINLDYQLKNKELAEMNDDLNNYFRSNVNGQLYVNMDLILMKFSPGAVKHINLRNGDIGRPIGNISTNIKFETIEQDIKKVIKYGGEIHKEIEATDGKWYQLLTMPYLHESDNKIHGAMVTFNDITELKRMQFDLNETNNNLTRMNKDLDNFVQTAGRELLGPLANMVFSTSAIKDLKVEDTKLLTLIEGINSSVKKVSDLIQNMSAIGKIDANSPKQTS